MKKCCFIIIFGMLLCQKLMAIDLSRTNFSYLYDGTLDIKHQLTLKNGTFYIYLHLKTRPSRLNFLYQNGYKDKVHSQILILNANYSTSENNFNFKVQFKNISTYNLLVLEMVQNDISYYYDIPINSGIILTHPDFNLINISDSTVIIKNYLSLQQEYSVSGHQDSSVCYSYRQNFPPDSPPMISYTSSNNKTLLLDSVFFQQTIKPDSVSQLLFIQIDSTTNIGRGYIVVPEYFPKIRSYEELIHPLIYLSTKDEFEKIKKSKDKKKAFDNFWINLVKNKERAKLAIKKYYKNVSLANIYFTTYKEGWKTDQGIIFIIFGKPSEVKRNENEEKWSYFIFGEKITFNFKKIPNLFVLQHLSLQKNKNYSKIWFRQISRWRKGNL